MSKLFKSSVKAVHHSIGLHSMTMRASSSVATPVILATSKMLDIYENFKKDKNVSPQVIAALTDPTPYFNRKYIKEELFKSRELEAQDLEKFFRGLVDRKSAYSFLSGPNGVGKSELIKNVICTINAKDDPLRAVYVACDINRETFKNDLGLSLNVRPDLDVSYAAMKAVIENAAKLVTSQTYKPQQLLYVIDYVSNKIDYLPELELWTRKLCEIPNVSVALIGSDGSVVLSSQSLTEIRCAKKTISAPNKEHIEEYVQSLLSENEKALTEQIAAIIDNKSAPNFVFIQQRIMDNRAKFGAFNLEAFEKDIEEHTQLMASWIGSLCHGALRERTTEQTKEALKKLVKEVGAEPFDQEYWEKMMEDTGAKLANKQSLGYEMILNNYMMYITEHKKLQLYAPLVRNAISKYF